MRVLLLALALVGQVVSGSAPNVITATAPTLRDTFVRIVTLFKMRYVLSYVPKGVAAQGWHPVDVRLTRGAADIRARRGYQR